MNLLSRADLPELMDADALDINVYNRCLRDLAAVNRVTFTHRATLNYLTRATRHLPRGTRLSILDVAFGHGDLLRAIAVWAVRRGLHVTLSGLDLNPRSAAAARAATPPGTRIDYHTGDVFGFSPAQKPDFIVTSQFTHHLTDRDIIELLQWMEKFAARGWHIADLHRHIIAYYGFPLLTRIFGWHKIVRYDGTISIARSFRRRDWQNYLTAAGLDADISWKLPFRYCVSRIK
jgi:2-polyprenyl-3-methyl-5-hydroxy-6-metoxy-1,4-benzoquinol methylase